VSTIIVMSIMQDANELFLKKKFEKAIEKYEIILHDEPTNSIALNNKGYSFSKLRNYSEALRCYDECLKKNPNDKTVLINKISLFRKIGEFKKAFEICEKILQNNPNEMIVLYHKLRILKKLNRFLESNVICKKLLCVYPDNGDILYDMASNFLKIGDNEKFLLTLKKAVNVIPNLKNKSRNNMEFKSFHNNEQFLNIVLE
jgi:tetratricopeptide (TPR) repeat protein